jgi:3-deoxy-D-manno-octulosonic acid (KDO) 8-phosphate synthase
MEIHDQPARALSDGSNALPLERLPKLLAKLAQLAELVRGWGAS